MKRIKLRAFMMPMFMTVILLCWLAALWYGGRNIVFGNMTVGDLIKFIGYQRMMLWPMASIGMMIARLQRGSAALARINRIMDIQPDIRDDHRTRGDISIKGEVRFRNLSFQYPGSHFSLKDIDLAIPRGATVGIIGAVGSGKSSLVSLIMRLFDIPDGQLLIDGRDINTIPIRRLRSSIGYVPQDSFLFSETIRENISFGRPGVDFARVVEAARIARVADDIEQFPEKYDQLIGERGVTLSGGQKQRVAIARALVLDPSILILDDALSSVDTHTEEEILQGLRDYSKQRTTLIISHRISTVSSADFIIVLEDGKIIEKGTHAELLQKDGTYASVFRKQQLEEQIESEGD
jgi:ATP-binding cassette subfamily B protein